jgi:hypothetical protein
MDRLGAPRTLTAKLSAKAINAVVGTYQHGPRVTAVGIFLSLPAA